MRLNASATDRASNPTSWSATRIRPVEPGASTRPETLEPTSSRTSTRRSPGSVARTYSLAVANPGFETVSTVQRPRPSTRNPPSRSDRVSPPGQVTVASSIGFPAPSRTTPTTVVAPRSRSIVTSVVPTALDPDHRGLAPRGRLARDVKPVGAGREIRDPEPALLVQVEHPDVPTAQLEEADTDPVGATVPRHDLTVETAGRHEIQEDLVIQRRVDVDLDDGLARLVPELGPEPIAIDGQALDPEPSPVRGAQGAHRPVPDVDPGVGNADPLADHPTLDGESGCQLDREIPLDPLHPAPPPGEALGDRSQAVAGRPRSTQLEASPLVRPRDVEMAKSTARHHDGGSRDGSALDGPDDPPGRRHVGELQVGPGPDVEPQVQDLARHPGAVRLPGPEVIPAGLEVEEPISSVIVRPRGGDRGPGSPARPNRDHRRTGPCRAPDTSSRIRHTSSTVRSRDPRAARS